MNFQQIRRTITLLSVTALLSACMGIPLTSVPRLLKLPDQLLTLNPAEFKVAVQFDDRMLPPAGSSPTLDISIHPKNPADYAPVDRKIPMHLSVSNGVALGLDRADSGRRWLLYSFPAASQAELAAIQNQFKRIKADNDAKGNKGGGTFTVGISQDSMVVPDNKLDGTRWETWLQTNAKDGFFELWSGTVAQIKAQAKKTK
jgi:hypothetical protein